MTSELRAESIRRRMAEIRRDLNDTAGQISNQVRQLRDWRYYVRSHPWLFAAAAAAAGYLIVAERPRVVSIDPEALGALAGSRQLAVQVKPSSARTFAVAALGLLGNALVRVAAGYAVRKLTAQSADKPLKEENGRY